MPAQNKMTNFTPFFKPVPALPDSLTAVDQEPTICLTFSKEFLPYLLGLLEIVLWEDRFSGTAEEQAHSVAMFKQLVTEIVIGNCPECLGDSCQSCQNCTSGFCGVIEFEEEDDMSCRLRIERNGETAYLVEDCGCGDVRRYALTAIATDSESGAVGSGIDTIPTGTLTPPTLSSTNESCYFTKATDIIVARMQDYVDGLAGYALRGYFNFSGASAIIEQAQVIAAILRGEIDVNFSSLGLTASEIKAAMETTAFKNAISTRLEDRGLTGQLNRWNVVRLVQWLSPTLDIPTPCTPWAQSWGAYCNLAELNEQLALAAWECETGSTVPTGFETISAGTYATKVIQDYTFITSGGNPTVDASITGTVTGWLIAATTRTTSPAPPASGFNVGGVEVTNNFTPNTANSVTARGSATDYNALATALGLTLTDAQPQTISVAVDGAVDVFNWGGESGGSYHASQIWIIWED